MNARWLAAACLPVLLCGCLEVDQHPGWKEGQYAGKRDNRHFQTRFHGDRFSWLAALMNRNDKQNEYNRANP
ncbi:hypothetical protein [Pseudoduganella armeniaca]|uniref:Lipoprotein n=1 Tax=Pseudoduganella armeniaca TaxID=2072590 RepID=A0A2R4C9Q9_9BURK|nr:hypothetical protein [Pseudoduganella armeniaca]AVR96260.1 hypothetical protein C9I28_11490 [Pseudoduganella armeniaca]